MRANTRVARGCLLRSLAYLQLAAYKFALVLVLLGGSFDGGLIEETAGKAAESLTEVAGGSAVVRPRTLDAGSGWPRVTASAASGDSAHVFSGGRPHHHRRGHSLPNGHSAPLRC